MKKIGDLIAKVDGIIFNINNFIHQVSKAHENGSSIGYRLEGSEQFVEGEVIIFELEVSFQTDPVEMQLWQ